MTRHQLARSSAVNDIAFDEQIVDALVQKRVDHRRRHEHQNREVPEPVRPVPPAERRVHLLHLVSELADERSNGVLAAGAQRPRRCGKGELEPDEDPVALHEVVALGDARRHRCLGDPRLTRLQRHGVHGASEKSLGNASYLGCDLKVWRAAVLGDRLI